MFYAKCNICNSHMEYARKSAAKRAEKRKVKCKACKEKSKPKLERSCPSCFKTLYYKTTGDLNRAKKKNSRCPSCAKTDSLNKEYFVRCKECSEKHFYKWKKTADKVKKIGYVCKKCKKKKSESIIYKRFCKSCKKEIFYKNKYNYNVSIKKYPEVECVSCRNSGKHFSGKTRDCPGCKKEIKYETSDACTLSNKNNTLCKTCTVYLEENRNNMIKKGLWNDLYGKTPKEWADQYDIPLPLFYKSYKNFTSKNDLIKFCKNYEKYTSGIEALFSKKTGYSLYNKKVSRENYPKLNYRPDFKLSDNIYLNVDGLYWHSEIIQSDRYYHFNMRKEYEKRNLKLFQFREDEVYNKLNIIKSMISNAKGEIGKKIGARKCKIRKVSTEEAKNFLNDNHIKGYIASRHIGLYYQEELVSIMSYKIRKKYVKIDRFCSKANYSIIGGFSKLLKQVQKINKESLPIHYWVDLRYGSGNFLLNFGFKVEKETLGWEWTNFTTTYNRLQCRANMDDRGLSEKEHAEELGWYKIYDAGQRLYIKT